MAENAENVQDLDRDGVAGVTHQTDQGEETGGESQTSQAEEQAEKSLEDMSLEELEAQIQSQTDEAATENDDTQAPQAQEQPQPEALSQPNTPEVSDKAQSRFQELANSNKAKDEEIAALKAQLQSLQVKDLNIPTPPWKADPVKAQAQIPLPEVKPGEEITPEVYNQHVRAQAQAIAQGEIQAAKLQMERQAAQQAQMRSLDESMDYIKRTYPELDPNSPQYSKELDERIGSLVESTLNGNPEALRSQVDAIMGLRGAALKRVQQEEEIKLQAAQTALVPDFSVTADRSLDYNSLTPEEIEKMAGRDGGV